MKVIRSGDKNFEEKKAKMFEPGLTKEEQLKEIFKKEIKEMVYFSVCYTNETFEKLIEEKANQLVYEVKIRTKL